MNGFERFLMDQSFHRELARDLNEGPSCSSTSQCRTGLECCKKTGKCGLSCPCEEQWDCEGVKDCCPHTKTCALEFTCAEQWHCHFGLQCCQQTKMCQAKCGCSENWHCFFGEVCCPDNQCKFDCNAPEPKSWYE